MYTKSYIFTSELEPGIQGGMNNRRTDTQHFDPCIESCSSGGEHVLRLLAVA